MNTSITSHSENSRSRSVRWSAAGRVLVAALAMTPAFLGAGCKSPATELCEVACECEGCSQSEYEDCLGDGEAALEREDQAGCSSQYNDFLLCVLQEAECRNDEQFEFDGCSVEQAALSECDPSVCEKKADKLCECDLGCNAPPSGEPCSGQQECEARCIIAATCSDIINQPFGSDYFNCLQSC